MKLSEAIDKIRSSGIEISVAGSWSDPEISSVEYDNREIKSDGVIFSCCTGGRVDGHSFAEAAVARGAVALLCEREIDVDVPQIVVKDARASMGELASIVYDRPSNKMKMIALTGTNGKTTTSYMIRAILRAAGLRVGMLGTIVYDDSTIEEDADRTTPEGPDVQKMLARMSANGAEACVMEASSHGIHQGRIIGCKYDFMAFSNLTPEHLEYHKDMENYFAAKRELFVSFGKQGSRSAINADDPYGRRLLEEFGERATPFSVGSRTAVGCSAEIVSADISGIDMRIFWQDGVEDVFLLPLVGMHNASNALEALTIADLMGVKRNIAVEAMKRCPQVPGRMERYRLSNGSTFFVDYAHSPDGVEKVLTSLRPLTRGRLIIVWGAGGDRTPLKRPMVGEVMGRLADHIIITTDNPRSEDPAVIAKDVYAGAIKTADSSHIKTILDRGEAVDAAIRGSRIGDVVVVAGKGPERYIEYADRKVPFNDAECIARLARSAGSEVADHVG